MTTIIYLVLVILTGLCGVFAGQKLLLLLGLVLFAVPLVSLIFVRRSVKNLNISMEAPVVVTKGQTFTASLKTESRGLLPPGPIRMDLVCRNSLTGECIRRSCQGEDRFVLTGKYCGCLEVAVENIRICDWTGVLSIPFRETCSRRVLVMPDTFPLEAVPELSISNQMDSEEHSPYRKGQDRSETFQIREYVPGDSLRQIHWKLSSKMDHLMVRDASLPVDPSLLLFWDKRTDGSDPNVCDAMCEAFVSLAQAYIEAGISFRMVWNGELIHMMDITGEEQLPEAVAELMKSENPDASLSGAELFLNTVGNPEAGKILYLADRLPAELAAFAGNGNIHLLLCSSEPAAVEETEEGIPVTCFTPDNMEEELQYLLIE